MCIRDRPSLDLLTLNGLCACDSVLIPIQCEYYALEGLSELISTLKTIRKKYNPYLLSLIHISLDALCDLTGENASEAVIEQVFERFCVGK